MVISSTELDWQLAKLKQWTREYAPLDSGSACHRYLDGKCTHIILLMQAKLDLVAMILMADLVARGKTTGSKVVEPHPFVHPA